MLVYPVLRPPHQQPSSCCAWQATGAVSNIAMQPYGPYPGAAGYSQGQPMGGAAGSYPVGPSGPYGNAAAAPGPSSNPFGEP